MVYRFRATDQNLPRRKRLLGFGGRPFWKPFFSSQKLKTPMPFQLFPNDSEMGPDWKLAPSHSLFCFGIHQWAPPIFRPPKKITNLSGFTLLPPPINIFLFTTVFVLRIFQPKFEKTSQEKESPHLWALPKTPFLFPPKTYFPPGA